MDEQQVVAAFVEEHELTCDPAYRILDLAAEVGEIAADATKSSKWGADPEALDVKSDEIGDALFSLLAVANALDVDADDALDEALEKYRARIHQSGSASSKTETDFDT
ncbi:MazG-like family protein [Haladaptatus sp. AB618]|uniref:MazG-like family protein n=1 Tax=Haladaptatus sp. AB618 TaxID=2934173 RepID=UPI00209C2AE7|nr:MazG-like family protein [Haladaptatus sp. AB618]MCO8253766.1 MazG-like family protein [Haladaptatus sp. AB618]